MNSGRDIVFFLDCPLGISHVYEILEYDLTKENGGSTRTRGQYRCDC